MRVVRFAFPASRCVDKDLVFEFFAAFSRFEYALKREKYLKDQRRAEPDWKKYAREIEGTFSSVESDEFKKACAALTQAPPRVQVVTGGQLDWEVPEQKPSESTERYILRLVKIIRNNLFHGGKYPEPLGVVEDVARNERLLEAGITVLKQCLELTPSLLPTFMQAA